MNSTVRATGIAWYRQEDYAKSMKIMKDRHKLPDTYHEWLKQANSIFNHLISQGHIVEKAYIDPNTFPAWCEGKGLNVDADARMAFANEFVAMKYNNKS